MLQGPLALQLVGRDARGEPSERAAAARRLEFGLEIRAERWFVVCGLEVCDELVARRVPIFQVLRTADLCGIKFYGAFVLNRHSLISTQLPTQWNWPLT